MKLLTTEKPQSLVEKNVVNRVEVEKPLIIKKIEQRDMVIDHPGEDQPGDEYIKTQNQYTDKAVDVTVVIGEIVTQMRTMHRVGEGNFTSEFWLDLRHSERQYATFSENTLEMRDHSEKFMNVSDMQVPDEDDRHDEQSSQPNDQSKQQDRERTNLDQSGHQQD